MSERPLRPAAGESVVPGWLRQLFTAGWPEEMGQVLAGVRRRAGLSRRKAASRLRRHVRRQLRMTASEPRLRLYETHNYAPEPWLLVAYLEALEASLEDWVAVLVTLAEASDDPGVLARAHLVVAKVGTASKLERKQLLPTVRQWVLRQAAMVGWAATHYAVASAVGELVPGAGPESGDLRLSSPAPIADRIEQLTELVARLGPAPEPASEDVAPAPPATADEAE